jgi:hypothetical protein
MSKLIYQPRQDFFVDVSLFNLNCMLNEEDFEVQISPEHIAKIEAFLQTSKNSNILCFPEYCYSQDLHDIYRQFSDENGVIIIGGSGIEESGADYHAFCPVFIPGKETIKVYKKVLTVPEIAFSKGRLKKYPNETERHFNIEFNDAEFVFTVYICYDFLQENYDTRTDIVFIPQYESSPNHFIHRGNTIVQGHDNFVLGINNSNDTFRSFGFANLNKTLIDAFSKQKIRKKEYKDGDGLMMNEHHSIIYDLKDEQKISIRLNLANPVPKQYNFSFHNFEPSVLVK